MKNKWCCTAWRPDADAVVFHGIFPRRSVLRFRLTRRYFWRPRLPVPDLLCSAVYVVQYYRTLRSPFIVANVKKLNYIFLAREKVDLMYMELNVFRPTWFMLVYASYRLCSLHSWSMCVNDNIWANAKTLKIALWLLSAAHDGACNSALVDVL